MFLSNAWYVAGWSGDYGQELVAQTLLAQCVVLYRKRDGTPVALEDACPHRKLPLSKGRLKDDAIECGYHGLTFDGLGKCVAAPTQPDRFPKVRWSGVIPLLIGTDCFGSGWVTRTEQILMTFFTSRILITRTGAVPKVEPSNGMQLPLGL